MVLRCVVAALSVAVGACQAPQPEDPRSKAQALVASRILRDVSVRSVVVGESGLVCGYAEVATSIAKRPDITPFIARGDEVLLLSDGARFRTLEKGCGPDWVSPAAPNPVS